MIPRHKPEKIGISLDEHGWADVQDLIDGVAKRHPLDWETLEAIVATDEKQRYGFKFYLSKNGVWLTKYVPAIYLKIKRRNCTHITIPKRKFAESSENNT